MLFGMNRALDVQSLVEFLRRFGDHHLTTVLTPRMSEEEIHQVVDLLTAIMRHHLSDEEYHRLFLGDDHRH